MLGLSFKRTAYLLTALAGALLSAASYMEWCVYEGCRSLQGVEVYGVKVSVWGVAYFVVIAFLAAIPRLRGAGMVRAGLLGAGVGVEVVMVRIQWLLSEWCVVCLAVAFAVFLLCLFETARIIRDRSVGSLGRLGLLVSILLAVAGGVAGFYSALPLQAELTPPADYDKERAREELETLRHIGKEGSWPVIRVYSDYLCPYCQKKEPMLNEVIREYSDRARFYFCDLPIHGRSSQFYITMFLSCLLAGNSDAQILEAREKLFELAGQKVGTVSVVIGALTKMGIDMMTEPEPIEAVYNANINLAELDGVTSTPTVVVESRAGRRRILKGKFEKEDFVEALESMD